MISIKASTDGSACRRELCCDLTGIGRLLDIDDQEMGSASVQVMRIRSKFRTAVREVSCLCRSHNKIAEDDIRQSGCRTGSGVKISHTPGHSTRADSYS